MSLYSDLREYLSADATLAQIVTLVRMTYAEQEDGKPFVAVVPQSEDRIASHSTGSGDKVECSVDINCHAVTFEDANAIKEAVRRCLDCYRGVMGSTAIRKCGLKSVYFDNPDPRQGQGNGDHVARMSFDILADEEASEAPNG
jgi:hypothetical protein